jgi:hypothetical protein
MHQGYLASYFINGNGFHGAKSWQIVLNSYIQRYMIMFMMACSFSIQCGATNSNGLYFSKSDIPEGAWPLHLALRNHFNQCLVFSLWSYNCLDQK